MLKYLFAATLLAITSQAWGTAVDVNTADDQALMQIKGIGPAKARAILDEREAHGPFRNAGDLAQRVRGLGGKNIERLRAAGLKIDGDGPPIKLVRPLRAPKPALHYNR